MSLNIRDRDAPTHGMNVNDLLASLPRGGDLSPLLAPHSVDSGVDPLLALTSNALMGMLEQLTLEELGKTLVAAYPIVRDREAVYRELSLHLVPGVTRLVPPYGTWRQQFRGMVAMITIIRQNFLITLISLRRNYYSSFTKYDTVIEALYETKLVDLIKTTYKNDIFEDDDKKSVLVPVGVEEMIETRFDFQPDFEPAQQIADLTGLFPANKRAITADRNIEVANVSLPPVETSDYDQDMQRIAQSDILRREESVLITKIPDDPMQIITDVLSAQLYAKARRTGQQMPALFGLIFLEIESHMTFAPWRLANDSLRQMMRLVRQAFLFE